MEKLFTEWSVLGALVVRYLLEEDAASVGRLRMASAGVKKSVDAHFPRHVQINMAVLEGMRAVLHLRRRLLRCMVHGSYRVVLAGSEEDVVMPREMNSGVLGWATELLQSELENRRHPGARSSPMRLLRMKMEDEEEGWNEYEYGTVDVEEVPYLMDKNEDLERVQDAQDKDEVPEALRVLPHEFIVRLYEHSGLGGTFYISFVGSLPE